MGKKIAKLLKGELVSSIFYMVFGFCLVLAPVQMINLICKVVFGLMLIGAGLYHIYIYVREKEKATIVDMFTGVIVAVMGSFLFYNSQIVVKLLPLMLGAFVLVDCIWTLRGAFRLKKRNRPEWKAFLIASIICLILGAVMMWNPFSGIRMTILFAGWVFLCNGVADIVFFILLRRGMTLEQDAVSEETRNKVLEEAQEVQEDVQEVQENQEEILEEWKDGKQDE
jgi:uncharacterized membrane protein HdeD (DUF308 family)